MSPLPKGRVVVGTADTLIADHIVKISDINTLDDSVKRDRIFALMRENEIVPKGKKEISTAVFNDFCDALTGVPNAPFPGGSSLNTLTTFTRLLPETTSGIFLGSLGSGHDSRRIRLRLERSNIELINVAEKPDAKEQAETAISYVFHYPDGERAIATHTGNARKLVKPQYFDDEFFSRIDIFLMQAGVMKKFSEEVFDKILEMRAKHKTPLVMALPTSAFKPEKARWAKASANLTLGNVAELGFLYDIKYDESLPAKDLKRTRQRESIILKLMGDMQESSTVLDKMEILDNRQVAFITDGANGVYVVNNNGFKHVPGEIVTPKDTLGAGDASFAGFMAGYVMNLRDEDIARLGMAVAGLKVQKNGPSLDTPYQDLRDTRPRIFENLELARKESLYEYQQKIGGK